MSTQESIPPVTPAVSIVIAAKNAAATIYGQLDAISAQETALVWEVVVVDDGSTDETRSIVEDFISRRANIRLIAGPGTGVSAARNAGIRESRAPAIITVDADDVVGRGWLSAMAAALGDSPFVAGAVEIQRLNSPRVAQTRGTRLTFQAGSYSGLFEFAHSCNLGVHRAVFDSVGGFDESLSAGEDIDFSYRCWRIGIPLAYAESAVVHYRYRTTLIELWRQGRSYGRVRPVLRRRFADDGLSVPAGNMIRSLGGVFLRLPSIFNSTGRANWVFATGGVFGELFR